MDEEEEKPMTCEIVIQQIVMAKEHTTMAVDFTKQLLEEHQPKPLDKVRSYHLCFLPNIIAKEHATMAVDFTKQLLEEH